MKNIYLFILLVVVLIVGFGIFILSMYQDEVRRIEHERVGDLSIITDAIANDLGYIFTTTERDLKLLASIFYDRKTPTSAELSDMYTSAFDMNSFLINIFYMDSAGIMQAIGPKQYSNEVGNNYSFRKYFQRAKKNKTSIFSSVLTNLMTDKNEKKYKSIIVVLPVYNKKNQLRGLFGANLDIDKLQNRIHNDTLSKGMSNAGLYFIDYKNQQIVVSANNYKQQTPLFDNFLLSVGDDAGLKRISENTAIFKGRKYYYSSKLIKNKKFTFQVLGIFPFIDSVFTLEGLYKQIWGLVLIVGAVILIVLFMIIYNEKILKKLKHKIMVLEISIDNAKKEKEITNITESSYYQELQEKIDSIKHKK